jgi:peptidoglycan/LPS O-acetylase OafA/YrhL
LGSMVKQEFVRRLPRSASLDGVRAIAVVLTSLVHLMPHRVPGGVFGVDVFFVLSGFLITSLLLGELSDTGRLDLKRFYVRRARRLLPAVAALLIVFTVVVVLSARTPREILVAGVVDTAVLTYTFNWTDVFGHQPPWQVDHLWSLSLEEQFYIVWPILLLLVLRKFSRQGAVVITLAAVLASALAQDIVYDLTASTAWAYLSSPLHAHGILLGCVLAMVFTWRLADRQLSWLAAHSWPAAVAGIGIIVASFFIGVDDKVTYSGGMFAVVLAAGLVVVTLASQDAGLGNGRLHRVLGVALLVAIGRRSYSIYLWQNFMAWALTPLRGGPWWIPANIVATLLAAEISYRFIERRFMRPRRRPDQALEHPPAGVMSTSS